MNYYTISQPLLLLHDKPGKRLVDDEFRDEVHLLICNRLGKLKKQKRGVSHKEALQIHMLLDMFIDACGGKRGKK